MAVAPSSLDPASTEARPRTVDAADPRATRGSVRPAICRQDMGILNGVPLCFNICWLTSPHICHVV